MSDEWISVFDQLPPLDVEVETSRRPSEIKENKDISDNRLIRKLEDGSYHWFITFIDNNLSWSHWRKKIKKQEEKQNIPNFEKLKEGDLIFVNWVSDKEYHEVGFFIDIVYNSIKLKTGNNMEEYFLSASLTDIKKITRINIEKHTFEEI